MKKIIVIGSCNENQKNRIKESLQETEVEVEFLESSFLDKTLLANELPTIPIQKDLTNLVVYLNAGHGNFDGTTYHTFKSDGKFYNFTEGNKIIFSAYEGETNRIFANKIKEQLEKRGAEVVLTHLPTFDLHNFQRIQIANTHFQKAINESVGRRAYRINVGTESERVVLRNKKFIWFSLHSNALSLANRGAGTTANGIEVFTSNNASQNSVSFANQFMQSIRPIFDKYKVANRGHKKAEFTELVGTQMPAILIENLFFDNLREARLLINETYQNDFCEACMSCFTWYSKQN